MHELSGYAKAVRSGSGEVESLSTMASKSNRQSQRLDVYQACSFAWANANYARVHELLEHDQTLRGRILIARASLRLKDFASAHEALVDGRTADPEEMDEADILRAFAVDCLEGSAQDFAKTRLAALTLRSKASHDVHSMLAFYRAYALFVRKEHESAYERATIAATSKSKLYRAWGLDLMAWIEVSQKKFSLALDHFGQCVELLSDASPVDEHKRLNALHGYAFLAVETLDRPAIVKLCKNGGAQAPYLRGDRFVLQLQCYVSLAFSLLGDDTTAFTTLVRALEASQRGTFTALPHILLSSLHERRGSADAAALHLHYAQGILEEADWKEEDDEARILLLHYAAQAASSNRVAAFRLFAKAMNLTGKANPGLAHDKDGRSKALAFYTKGCLEVIGEQRDAALDDLKIASDLWASIGYRYRATIANVKLLRLGVDRTAEVPRVGRQFQKSWLAVELGNAASFRVAPLGKMTQVENRIIDGICEGLSSREIASRTGRSPSTIRNQTIKIYRSLGVHSRAALVTLVTRERKMS